VAVAVAVAVAGPTVSRLPGLQRIVVPQATKRGRVAPVDNPGAPIDPDVRDYRIRLLGIWVRYAGAE